MAESVSSDWQSGVAALAGCSSDETVAADDHDPVTVELSVDGAPPAGMASCIYPKGRR